MSNLFALILLLLALVVGGCGFINSHIATNDIEVRMNRRLHILPITTVRSDGDYALYYEGDLTPEIPVRCNAGDKLGFFAEPDGRIKAVAGSFKMDIDPKKNEAYWQRIAAK